MGNDLGRAGQGGGLGRGGLGRKKGAGAGSCGSGGTKEQGAERTGELQWRAGWRKMEERAGRARARAGGGRRWTVCRRGGGDDIRCPYLTGRKKERSRSRAVGSGRFGRANLLRISSEYYV
jgi:hypothetical protein